MPGFDQGTLDRIVTDKVRAGQTGSLTLFEIQRASPGVVPRDLIQRLFQGMFTRLQHAQGVARLEWKGADLSLFEASDAHRLVVMLETGDLDKWFVFPGAREIPAVRFWLNEEFHETLPSGEWEWE